MGGSQSKPTGAAAPAVDAKKHDWGEPPTNPPKDETDISELVLQTWAQCKAKPTPQGMFKSDDDEKRRRDGLQWRKRQSFIELDCGEDSFFVANTYKTIGVADGVGGWRDEGIDAADFSNTLMRWCKHYCETHRKEQDPEKIVQNAFEKIKDEKLVRAGSSTVCLASLTKDPETKKHYLDVMNLGDSGAMIIRNRQMVFRVHEKVHGFNAPFQLSILPKHLQEVAYSDRVGDAIRERVEVGFGDIVILGTDGLFDNRFNSQLVEDCGWLGEVQENAFDKVPVIGGVLKAVLGVNYRIEYADPYRVTQRQVQEAYKNSISKDAQTPWSVMLQEYGVPEAKGGKADDITILVAKVTTREEQRRVSMW